MEDKNFHSELKELMNKFAHGTYDYTKYFPREEIYGIVSQLRRAGLSVVLNYIEGHARHRKAVFKNFLEISYGSLQESKYLIQFSFERKYLNDNQRLELTVLADRIGAMSWGILRKVGNSRMS